VLFVFAASGIRFKEDISRFLPQNKDNERINNAYQYVASSNTVSIYCSPKKKPAVSVIDDSLKQEAAPETGDAEANEDELTKQTEAIDAFAELIRTRLDSSYIKSLFYKINPEEMPAISSFIVGNMPYFLDENDYRRIDTLLTREAIARRLSIDKNILTSTAGMLIKQNFLSDPLQMSSSVMAKLQDFKVGDQYYLHQDHLFSQDKRALMFIDCTIPVSESDRNAVLIDSIKSFIKEVESQYPDILLSSFGAAEISLSNSTQIRKDTLFSSLPAVIIVFLLLIYTFRSGRKILLVFASVLFGGLFALAFLYILRGEVSVIAIGISSIMFGIALNYPLHFIEHYNHVSNPQTVIKDIVHPLTVGNITTVCAFMSLLFLGSDAMVDLGLFASLLLVGTVVFVLFFLPHLLPKAKKRLSKAHDNESASKESSETAKIKRKNVLSQISGYIEGNKWLVPAVVLLTIFFSFFSGGSSFETDMQKINFMTESQKESYKNMMGLLNQNQHIIYYVTEADNIEHALEVNERNMPLLKEMFAEGEISKIGGVGDFFPSKKMQTEKIRMWNDFWITRRDNTLRYIREESKNLGFRDDAFSSFEEMTDHRWEVVDLSHFAPLRESLAKNYIIEKDDKSMVVNMLYTDPSNARMIEEKLAVYNPSSIAFDAGSITRRMISSLSDNFNFVLFVCGFIVFVFLLCTLGRIELALIAFTPLALSWIWILGIMSIFDIKFNIVNIILATFIFGQGDDYTIFMTEGLMYEYSYRKKILSSFKKSIALSAAIMFVGMGMLVFAGHPALRSLAQVTVTGMFTVVMTAFIFPPFLYRMLTLRKGKSRMTPLTLRNVFSMIYAFVYFLIRSFILTIQGWIIFSFGRVTEEKKMKYHRIIYHVANFVIYRMPQVKTTFRNPTGETFDKPGIIICNHQSHLDLMCIMMLTPKLIILTNDWVWNSPFYGRLIKFADFYPVSNGIENSIGKLADSVKRGYSIVVFPEGTRSADCSIQRFHRGAFFLAEKLDVDIIPVMIHGVGHVLPKEEFMLRKGQIHIQVMPRITPGDERFRKGYASRSKEIRHYYQAEYRKLCDELETPDYYADLVKHNYIYKGTVVEREVRRNLRQNKNYIAEIQSQPCEGEVVIQNSGYGEYPLLLSLVRKNLRVTVIEPDEDKRLLASNCSSVPPNLVFADRI
jgi:1-acyl-sn-glycerol-3-phosphate acyltransferase